jgi:hypothetical protein
VKGEINEKTCDCHYENVIGYIRRIKGGFDQTFYKQVIGASNVFKEGNQAIGVCTEDEATRQNEWIMESADKYLFCGENVSFPLCYHEILSRHGNRQGEYDSNLSIHQLLHYFRLSNIFPRVTFFNCQSQFHIQDSL